MKIKFLLAVMASIMCLSQAKAQSVCMSDLIGKTWQAVSGYDGSSNVDWSIVFTKKSSEHAFTSKTDKKVSKFLYNTYLCNDAVQKYDAALLGNNAKGRYLVFERKYESQKKSYEDLFLAQVLSFDGNKLVIKLKKSIVTFVAK